MRALLLFLSLVACTAARAAMPAADAEAFAADLDLLAAELPRRHANLFHATPREEFERAVAALRAELPALDRAQAIVGLARIAGLAQDGHTALYLRPFPGQPAIAGIRQLPLQLHAFGDGLRIVAIERGQRGFLGARITRIGDVAIDDAIARVVPLLPRDNAMGEREHSAIYLSLAEVVHALGMAEDAGRITFGVDRGRGDETLALAPSSVAPDARWVDRLIALPGPRDAWVGAGDDAPVPRWLSRSGDAYWSDTLDDGTVYVQINQLRDAGDETFAAFVDRVLGAVPRDGAAKLVVDLRLNRGGNGDLAWALVHALIRHDAVNQPGRLFVLAGRRTFSAAQLLANALEKHTRAVFVGEPTGSSPNHYGELGQLALPRTGLVVMHSQLYWQHDPRDRRPWIPPHIAIDHGYADLAAGRDPALDAVRSYVPAPAVSAVMGEAIEAGRIDDAVAAMRKVAATHRNPWRNLFEKELNDAGYGLLGERPDAAHAVFLLATELYPDSANAWDSLGESYLGAGNRARAAYCYARSVRLNPRNVYGIEALDRILGKR